MFADESLAYRIEASAKELGRLSAAAYSRLSADAGETFRELERGHAVFTGDRSPLTQAHGRFSEADLDTLGEFYRGRASEWEAILTPFTGMEALARLLAAGARPVGWESTLYRPTETVPEPDLPSGTEIVEVGPGRLREWTAVAQKGFFGEEANPTILSLSRVMETMGNTRRYLALWEGEPAAAATLVVSGDAAFLGGAATLPEFRRRGLQTALILRRLHEAGTEVAFATLGATPGGPSQRNAERVGFRLAYTQLSLMVPVDGQTTPQSSRLQ